MLSKCFAYPPHEYLLCFSLALSSCLVYFWYPFSPVVYPLVLIFWDWGFGTCKVTASLLSCPQPHLDAFFFHSLGFPGGTLDKMCSITYCPDISFFLIGKGKGPYVSVLNWIAIFHTLWVPLCQIAAIWIRLFSGRKIGARTRIAYCTIISESVLFRNVIDLWG